MSKCQLCNENEQEWAVIVPYLESNPVLYHKITHENEFDYPHWLICNTCKENRNVDKTRKQMYANEVEYKISAI